MDEPNFLNHKEVHAYVESTKGENDFFFFFFGYAGYGATSIILALPPSCPHRKGYWLHWLVVSLLCLLRICNDNIIIWGKLQTMWRG